MFYRETRWKTVLSFFVVCVCVSFYGYPLFDGLTETKRNIFFVVRVCVCVSLRVPRFGGLMETKKNKFLRVPISGGLTNTKKEKAMPFWGVRLCLASGSALCWPAASPRVRRISAACWRRGSNRKKLPAGWDKLKVAPTLPIG